MQLLWQSQTVLESGCSGSGCSEPMRSLGASSPARVSQHSMRTTQTCRYMRPKACRSKAASREAARSRH
eukprot:3582039-Prymnesium_polylepis.1